MRTLLLAAAALPLAGAALEITVTNERNQPIWARLEVHGPGGTMLRPEEGIRSALKPDARSAYLGSFVIQGHCRLDVAPGRYRIVAEHGTEYERVERSVDSGSGAVVKIRLRPWIRMRERGWWSGDMHIHRPVEHAEGLVKAEDLNVGIVFTMWNRQNLWSNKPVPADPVTRIDGTHLVTLMNAEDERGGGAWMLHQIREPLGLETVVPADRRPTESWMPPGLTFVRRARAARSGRMPWFDSEKPIWWEVPVMMALEPPDSLGLLHNHFNQYGVRADEAWGRPRDTGKFPGVAGFVDYSLSLYYRYLNLGMRIPPSAGSASGVLPNPVGYNRMYVKLDGPLDVDKWYEGVKAGRVFVTNGPMLFWQPKAERGRLTGTLEAMAREPIERCEIVANGEVVWKRQAAGLKMKARFDIDVQKHSWAAARCYLKTAETVRMAHTAPVYLEGKWDAGGDARYFVAWMDELMARPSSNTEELKELYAKARAYYAGLIAGATARRFAGPDPTR